jgi:hypothetical protein
MSATCDVLVVGAGVAGAAAAVAAAQGGVRTILVEKEHYLGGIGYAGMFQYICGLYLNGTETPAETLNKGLVRQIAALLQEAAPEKTVKKIGQVYVLPYTSESLQSVLTALCSREKDIATLRGHAVVEIEMEQNAVRGVTIEGARGRQVVQPKMVIDCSGSGEAAVMAGADFECAPPEERQLSGFTMRIRGMKGPDDSLSLKVPFHLAQAVQEGKLPSHLRFTMLSPGDAPDEVCCKMSASPRPDVGRDDRARSDATAVHAYLSSVLSAFHGSSIASLSPKVLDREGRRITGEYTLTEEDVLSARKFPGGGVKNSWPIELWDQAKGTVYRYVPRGEYYEIPLRCQTVRGITNLLTAGRCISVSHEALGSTRVMGACMALGEQAGRAAAYRVKHGKYPEKVKEI